MRTYPRVFSVSCMCLAFALSACSSDGGSGGAGGDGAREPDDAPIQGLSDDPVGESITDRFPLEPQHIEAVEKDLNGRTIERAFIEIVFRSETTTAEANALVRELGGTVTSSVGGYPSVVLRIPDPGSLESLDSLVSDLKSRAIVRRVLRSIRPNVDVLPPNIEEDRRSFIEFNVDPAVAGVFEKTANHLAIRGHAAWNAEAATNKRRTSVIVQDYFGQGTGDINEFRKIFNVQSTNTLSIPEVTPPEKCLVAELPAELETECEIYRDNRNRHGYRILSILAGNHIKDDDSVPYYATGIARSGIDLSVVDHMLFSALDIQNYAQLLRTTLSFTREGLVVESISLGDDCTGERANDACQDLDDLAPYVLTHIEKIRATDLEERVLIVAAAGNRSLGEPYDAESHSAWAASALAFAWEDDQGNFVNSLDNTLVVENARIEQSENGGAPYSAKCTNESSFIGGQVAGVGSGGIFYVGGPASDSFWDDDDDGGTSSATPQVSGLAAYMAAIDPDLKPREVIEILEATATELPTPSGEECTDIGDNVPGGPNEEGAPLIDAYAAVLALDPAGQVLRNQAKVRLALLDVERSNLDGIPDGRFAEQDLDAWLFALIGRYEESDGEPVLDYGRYDLNGDGYTGGPTTARFDLDISSELDDERYSAVMNEDLNDTLDTEVLFLEEALTDLEILCYYAYSDLYSGQLEHRDSALTDSATGVSLCDPCAIPEAGGPEATTGPKQLPQQCQGIAITVSPDPVTLAPGATRQFTATVTGSANTAVTWAATGGIIDPSGLYTAGNSEGDFTVTATSNVDPSAAYTATITIHEPISVPDISGTYAGTGQLFEGGRTDPNNVTVQTTIEQTGDQLIFRLFDNGGGTGPGGMVFTGTYDGSSVSAVSRTTGEGSCTSNPGGAAEAPCTFNADVSGGSGGVFTLSGQAVLRYVSNEFTEGNDTLDFEMSTALD